MNQGKVGQYPHSSMYGGVNGNSGQDDDLSSNQSRSKDEGEFIGGCHQSKCEAKERKRR